jgi:hypothetical protein
VVIQTYKHWTDICTITSHVRKFDTQRNTQRTHSKKTSLMNQENDTIGFFSGEVNRHSIMENRLEKNEINGKEII